MNLGQRVRSLMDGQIGHTVETEGGGLGVKLDRANENRVVAFNPNLWVADEKPPLGPMQVTRVAYEADRALRIARGEYGVAEWIAVKEAAKVSFMQAGPEKGADPIRRKLNAAILAVLKGA